MKSWRDWVAVAAILATVTYILRPINHGHQGSAGVAFCISNQKQIALGLLMYSSDFNDRLPNRDEWMDAAKRYYRVPNTDFERFLHCPKVVDKTHHYGYAINSSLKTTSSDNFESLATIPLLYESLNLARNASDPLLSILTSSRHVPGTSGILIGFLDGHASIKQPAWVKKIRR